MRKIFSSAGHLVAKIIPSHSLWSGPGLTFWSADVEFIQVGTWNHPVGTDLAPHIHNEFQRNSFRTQEVVFVVSGRVLASLFDEAGRFLEDIELSAGDLLVCLSGGHGYSILEKETRVLEIKNGPYAGPDVDRRRI